MQTARAALWSLLPFAITSSHCYIIAL